MVWRKVDQVKDFSLTPFSTTVLQYYSITIFWEYLFLKRGALLEQYEDEAVDEIIEEEERNVDAHDSKVKPEDGKSCDRALLQTQEKDLKR